MSAFLVYQYLMGCMAAYLDKTPLKRRICQFWQKSGHEIFAVARLNQVGGTLVPLKTVHF